MGAASLLKSSLILISSLRQSQLERTGLELDIVHRIVEGQHKGSVRLNPNLEKPFQVRIPINVATC